MTTFRIAAMAACLLFASPALAQQVTGTTLHINAEGSSVARPDIATVRLGVRTTGRTPDAVLTDNNRRIASLMAALGREGIAERDIKTEALSLRPTREG